jgi:hypothetical protein
MSTKRNNHPAAAGQADWVRGTLRRISGYGSGPGGARLFQRLFQAKQGRPAAPRYFALRARASARFPAFQPKSRRNFSDRTIRALKRWNFDLITMDEVCRRAVTLPKANRFACLTFDGGCKDVITQAYPVLSKHGVPFTVYLPTAFPDGLGEAWWLALEDMIAREDRISLGIDRRSGAAAGIAGNMNAFRISTSDGRRAEILRRYPRLRALLRRSRGAVAQLVDGLGRSGEARSRSFGDDRQRNGELSPAVQPESGRRAT